LNAEMMIRNNGVVRIGTISTLLLLASPFRENLNETLWRLEYVAWKHAQEDAKDEVQKLLSMRPVSALKGVAALEVTKKQRFELDNEDEFLGGVLVDEQAVWGRYADVTSRWLPNESKLAKTDLAFGILTSVRTLSRLGLLKHWWVPGAAGCIIGTAELPRALWAAMKPPPGLTECLYPSDWSSKPWFKANPDDARGALALLLLYRKFPSRRW
jgi:hypothetical protein